MANTTQLKQTDGAFQVKAGDFGSRFAYQLLDEHGSLMDELNGQTASVKLTLGEDIVYETDVTVDNSEVAFKFDKVLPAGKYWLEIWVDSYIFPSDRKTKIKVIKAAKEREVTPKKLPPVRDLAGNSVSKVIMHDTLNLHRDYPNSAVILINPDNTLEYADYRNIMVRKTSLADVDVVTISAPGAMIGENADVLDFMVDGQPYRLKVEVVRTANPNPPTLESREIVLNKDNGFEFTIPISGLDETVEGEMVTASIVNSQYEAFLDTFSEEPTVKISAYDNTTSRTEEVTLVVYQKHYADAITITVRVEVED